MMTDITQLPVCADRSPLLIERQHGVRSLEAVAGDPAFKLAGKLLEYGALLFRGFDVCDVPAFDRFIDALESTRSDYVYGSTPRQSVGNRIFTASEFPAAQEVPLHNENAYQRVWPLKVAFCCLQPAASGGETPLADMRCVTEQIGRELLDMFEARRIKYVRHYHPFVDVSWQQVFKTDSRAKVAQFCSGCDIQHEWLDETILRTTQVCQGTALHPTTRERVFFNQAHLFHASSLGPEVLSSMLEVFGPNRLPRQAYFGDGEAIPVSCLERIRHAFRQSSFVFPWRAGDVLLLDNMRYAHGRCSFHGTRRVIAALMDPHCP